MLTSNVACCMHTDATQCSTSNQKTLRTQNSGKLIACCILFTYFSACYLKGG